MTKADKNQAPKVAKPVTVIRFSDLMRLAKGQHSMPALRSVVFDGKSAMTAAPVDWMPGVPFSQPALSEPVVVPVEAIQAHMLKSRHLIVTPDGLTNGQGLVTPFNKKAGVDYDGVIDMLPKPPQGKEVSFDLELDALDRTLIAAGTHDIRYYLNGVLFDLTNGVLIGCDGHRMHLFENRVPKAFKRKVVEGVPQGPAVEVIVGRDPLRWIVGSQSQTARVTMWNAQRDSKAGTAGPNTEIMLRTIDGFVWVRRGLEGKFPDWNRVLPKAGSRPVWAELDPAELSTKVEAMTKVVKLASEGKRQSVWLDFGKQCVMGESEADVMPMTAVTLHSADESVVVEDIKAGLWMGVQGTYLQDLADCVTKHARWMPHHLNTPDQALFVRDGDFAGVVMPIRYDKPQPAPEPVQGGQPAPEPVQGGQEAPEPVQGGQEAPEPVQGGQEAPKAARKARKVAKPARVVREDEAEAVPA